MTLYAAPALTFTPTPLHSAHLRWHYSTALPATATTLPDIHFVFAVDRLFYSVTVNWFCILLLIDSHYGCCVVVGNTVKCDLDSSFLCILVV